MGSGECNVQARDRGNGALAPHNFKFSIVNSPLLLRAVQVSCIAFFCVFTVISAMVVAALLRMLCMRYCRGIKEIMLWTHKQQ